MDLSEFYDVPPFVICTWTETPDQMPTTFYPIVNERMDPMTSDDLGIAMSPFGTRPSARKHILTVGILLSHIPGVEVVDTFMEGDVCYAVALSLSSSKKGKNSSRPRQSLGFEPTLRTGSTFMIPVVPERTKPLSPSKRSDPRSILPSIDQLRQLFSLIEGVYPLYSPSVKSIVSDEKGRIRAFVLYPDGVVIHVQPTADWDGLFSPPPKMERRVKVKEDNVYEGSGVSDRVWDSNQSLQRGGSIPRMEAQLHSEVPSRWGGGFESQAPIGVPARTTSGMEKNGAIASLSSGMTPIVLPSHIYNLLWEESGLYRAVPTTVDSPLTELNIRITQLYLAASLVRSGAVSRLVSQLHIKKAEDRETGTESGVLSMSLTAAEPLTHSPNGMERSGDEAATDSVGASTRETRRKSGSDLKPKSSLTYDDLLKWFQSQCKGLVIISSKVRFVLVDDNVVMLSERISITRELYEAATIRLASSSPKNVELLLPYLRSFGTVLRPDDVACRAWEKVLA
jgi:hypothetical protein